MDPGSAKWTVFWSEKVNGGELGAPDSQSLGNYQVGSTERQEGAMG